MSKISCIVTHPTTDRTLTDTKIKNKASLQKALTILHETYSVPNVVISSIPMERWLRDLTPPHIRSSVSDEEQSLLCLASARVTADGGGTPSRFPSSVYAGCVPLIEGYFSGVGDLFSAFVLGHYTADTQPLRHLAAPPPEVDGSAISPTPTPTPLPFLPPLPRAVSLALTKTYAILRLTEKYASSLPPDERTTTDDELDEKDPGRRIRRMRGRELRLVQGRKILSGEAMGELRLVREWENFWGPS
jgi:pyridoxine kinase